MSWMSKAGESRTHTEDQTMPQKLFRALMSQYGPYAFGIISVMIIWQFVVQPELRHRDAEIMGYREFAASVREATAANVEAARLFRESTALLADTTKRLEQVIQTR